MHPVSGVTIRDARKEDAPFLAECILAGFHFSDFDEMVSDDMSDALERLTECEACEDTLYSFTKTRVAEVDGTPAGALLSYPGELFKELRDRTFRQYWPSFFELYPNDEPEADPGEYYLDSLAVHPDFRKRGLGKVLLMDGIQKGVALGFKKVTLIADTGYPHLISFYEALGFVPEGHRHVTGTEFQRLIYTLPE